MAENRETLTNQRNINYKSDTEYTLGIPRKILTLFGIWPLQRGDSFSDKIKTAAHVGLIFALLCFFFIPQATYTIVDCEDLTRYMKVLASQMFSVVCIIKFWTMVINRKEIKHCLMEMEVQYRDVEWEEDLLVMKKSAKVGRMCTTLYLSLSYSGGIPYHIVLPLMSDRIVMRDNSTRIPLPYQSNYVFFAIEESPSYEILFVVQILISGIVLSSHLGIYSLVINVAMHSCGLFAVANRRMETVLDNGQEGVRGRLADVVRHHLKAIQFTQAIENALSILFLFEMIFCTIIICFLEYGILVDLEDGKTMFSIVTYVILVLSIFLLIYILSFIGDRIKQESEKVAEISYFVQWYNLPEDLAKHVKMIILRANRPTSLTAGKLFDLSFLGFCDVCKTSAAYFNFLRTMTA